MLPLRAHRFAAAVAAGIVVPPVLLATAVSQANATQIETNSFTSPASGILLIEVHTVNNDSTTAAMTFSGITIGASGRAAGTGTAISATPKDGKSASRINTQAFLYLTPSAATGQTVQVTLGNTSRGTVIRVWHYDLANRAAQTGASAGASLNGSQTSSPISLTTNTAGSVVHYCGAKTYSGVTISIAGATEIDQRGSGGAVTSEDIETWAAYETAPTTGAYDATASWTAANNQSAIGIEVLKA